MLSQMPNLPLMLMPMLMPGTVAMATVLDMEDIEDTMGMPDHMDTDTMEDTGERRRGLLMPPLMPMLMLTLTTLDTMVLVLDTVHMDTMEDTGERRRGLLMPPLMPM